ALDGYKIKGLGPERNFSDLIKTAPRQPPIDAARAKEIDHLMEEVGLQPRPKQRVIGQYSLDSGEPLGEGPGWQDFLVTNPKSKLKHRLRLFPYPKGSSQHDRDAIDARAVREMRLTYGITHEGIVGP